MCYLKSVTVLLLTLKNVKSWFKTSYENTFDFLQNFDINLIIWLLILYTFDYRGNPLMTSCTVPGVTNCLTLPCSLCDVITSCPKVTIVKFMLLYIFLNPSSYFYNSTTKLKKTKNFKLCHTTIF